MPRKGHVNKDGTIHAKHGEKAARNVLKALRTTKETTRRIKKVSADVFDEPKPTEPVFHGVIGSGAITEPCPQCMYAYADGGYCPECGWTMPIERLPWGTAGRKLG
jgi:hypothetical protein